MPSKRAMRFTGNRTAAIGLIVVCIVATAILIAARTSTSEPTSAAPAPHVQTAITSVTAKPASPVAKAQKPAAVTAAKPAAAQAAANAPAQNAEPVTIVGCLVQNDETFRLKNTTGEDAPKGRSWKSGFLKKSSKTIEVLDERQRLNLASHVGEQVSVTGMLEDKELQGTSLKRVAESCN